MKIPQDFKTNIANTFYDKTISLYNVASTTEADGWTRQDTTLVKTFAGNCRFDKLDQIQKDYGLEEQIDIVISTHEAVNAGQVVGYNSNLFKITKAIPFDSHYLLMGSEWSSKQSD